MNKKGFVQLLFNPIVLVLIAAIALFLILIILFISALNKCALPREPLENVSYSYECVLKTLWETKVFKMILIITGILIIVLIMRWVIKKFRN